VLELSPDDMPTRASAPQLSFGTGKAHATEPDSLDLGAFDYDPDLDAVRPSARSVDFSRGRWRDELSPDPEAGPEAGDYDIPELDHGNSGVLFERQVGRSDLEVEQEADDTDYDVNISLVKPRTDRGGVNMERDTVRASFESTEDDRDYDPKLLDNVLGAVVFDGQLTRDTDDGLETDDDRDYNPVDVLVHPQVPSFTFDKRTGRSVGEDPVDERDYEEPQARERTMPTSRSVDFSSAPEREDDVNDGGLSGPGTREEKEAAADRDFYTTPGALDPEKNVVEFDRQITREDLEQDEEVLDLVYNTDDKAVRPRVVGLVEMDIQVGRESLDGDEAELLCNPFLDEDYKPDLRPTRPSLRGFSMGSTNAPDEPWTTVFAPTGQSVDVGPGSYTPNELERDGFRGLSQRASAPVLSFTKARVGDRLRKLEKLGPPLLPRDSMDQFVSGERQAGAERAVAKSVDQLRPLRPRSILKVRLSIDEDAGTVSQATDMGVKAGHGRWPVQDNFIGLTQSMPAEKAAAVMEEMQRTRAMTARLKQRMTERSNRRGVTFADSGEPAREPPADSQLPPGVAIVNKVTTKKVRFADETPGGVSTMVSRLHVPAPHKIANRKKKNKKKREEDGRRTGIENVEEFVQNAAERDRSFVAGPHIGRGRRELRRRLELEKEEVEAKSVAVESSGAAAVAAEARAHGEEGPQPEPEPQPESPPEPQAPDLPPSIDLGPGGGGYE
jgi:hypothetical protein